jgi:hypothetical protein
MKNPIRALLLVVAIVAACSPFIYGKVDAPSVKVTQTFPAISGLPTPSQPVDVPPVSFTFDIGEIIVGEGDQDSSLTLNEATLSMADPSTTTVNFEGIDRLTLSVTSGTQEVTVAEYVKGSVPVSRSITLAPTGNVNLLPYLSGKGLMVKVSGTGIPPGPLGTSWTPQLLLDFHVIAQHNVL